jgi:tetrahydromethanopterin S-methyltransferase subunit G
MKIREEDKIIIKKYIKHIMITEDDYNKLKSLNENMVKQLNSGKPKKYQNRAQPVGRIISLLLKEHKTKTDYITIRRKQVKLLFNPINEEMEK